MHHSFTQIMIHVYLMTTANTRVIVTLSTRNRAPSASVNKPDVDERMVLLPTLV